MKYFTKNYNIDLYILSKMLNIESLINVYQINKKILTHIIPFPIKNGELFNSDTIVPF
jgi:hypothetical protein